MWPNPQFPADLITLSEEILNGKLYFLYSGTSASLQFVDVFMMYRSTALVENGLTKNIPLSYGSPRYFPGLLNPSETYMKNSCISFSHIATLLNFH